MKKEKVLVNSLFNETANRFRMASQILSGSQNIGFNKIFYDESNCKNELHKLIGVNGWVNSESGEKTLAQIPFVQNKIKEIDKKFVALNVRRKSQGLPELLEMQRHEANEKTIFEAKLQVLQEEQTALENRIQEFENVNNLKIQNAVQESRPLGHRVIMKNQLVSIDGLPVTQIDGIFCIDSEVSPWDGHSVSDYEKNIIQPYLKACAELAKKNREKALAEGLKTSTLSKGFLSGSGAKVPKMPASCKNYKKVETKI